MSLIDNIIKEKNALEEKGVAPRDLYISRELDKQLCGEIGYYHSGPASLSVPTMHGGKFYGMNVTVADDHFFKIF
jgi:hypothetical protein